MIQNVFDIATSFKAATHACSQEEFERVISSSQVASVMSQISSLPLGGDGVGPREWKDKVNALKKQLPVLMPHAHFTDGRRHGKSAERSPWVSQDYDGIEDPKGFWDYIVAKHAEELHIVLAFISPSGKGVKIIFQAPQRPSSPSIVFTHPSGSPGIGESNPQRGEPSQGDELMTIKEAQAWFAKVIGEPDYDAQTFDLARCVYLVPRKNFLYYRPSMMFGDPLPTFKVDLPHNGEALNTQGNSKSPHSFGQDSKAAEPSDGGDAEGREGLQVDAEGKGGLSLPYGQIIPEFFKLECSSFPTVPVGMRNSTIFNVTAKYLRYCTDHRFDQIKTLLYPDYSFGLDEAEIDSIIKSALSRERSLTPRKVKEILAKFSEGGSSPQGETEEGSSSCPEMPKVLPEFIRLITSKVPDCMKPAVATQIFPALAAHLHQVSFRFIDNTEIECGLLGVCIGKQSIGKGCVNKPIDNINADLKEVSEKNKALARQWRKESAESENDDTGLLPEDIYFPLPLPNMTDAAFTDRLRRAEHNGDRSIFTRMDEIELLYQVNVGGSLKPDRLICLAYDHAEYGQERVSSNAISDSAKMRWSWVASTTPLNARVFFSKNNGFLNGALSRVNICTIFQPDVKGYMPVYGIYDDKFTKQVQGFVNRLTLANGLVFCQKVNKFIERLRLWCVDKEDEYEGEEHDIWCDFYKRSLVIAFRKSMILYILNGQKWTKSMEDFIEWSLKYDLWCKLYYFSAMMIEAYKGQNSHVPVMTQGKRVNKMDILYSRLPDEFTKKDVEENKEKLMLFSPYKTIMFAFREAGIVEQTGKKTYKKVRKLKG